MNATNGSFSPSCRRRIRRWPPSDGWRSCCAGFYGAGKTTLAKLLCRLYDPQSGAIEIDGVDLRDFDLSAWRERITAVFQDFIRFELPLRDNVAPAAPNAPDSAILAALTEAGASQLALTENPTCGASWRILNNSMQDISGPSSPIAKRYLLS